MNKLIFHPIDISCEHILRPWLERTRYIDLGFGAIYYTAQAFDFCYALVNEDVVLRLNGGSEYAYIADAKLLPVLLTKLKNPWFEYVMDEDIAIYESYGARITCDDRFSDYLCTYEDYIAVKKSVAPSKYKDYNQFLKKHDAGIEEITDANMSIARDLLENWCEGRDCSLCAYGCEKEWIKRMFDAWQKLRVRGFLLKIDGAFCAFNVAEQNGDTLLKLVAKPVDTPNGAMVYFGVESARMFSGVKYVNLGAHSGTPGLMSFKNKFKPYEKLKKYTARFARGED